jgi:hypothetical protein
VAKVFYFCFDDPRPAGGEMHSYRHVDILRAAGVDAFAVHTTPGYRHRWFRNRTKVIDLQGFGRAFDARRDVVVLPEIQSALVNQLPGRKVIFVKGAYLALAEHPDTKTSPYRSADVISVLAVSRDNRDLLEFAYPGLPVELVRLGIDAGTMRYRLPAEKPRRIVLSIKITTGWTPVILDHLLRERGRKGLNKRKLFRATYNRTGRSHAQMLRLLERSVLLIFLSSHEGFGYTPLEAMACGCLVVAYRAGPLPEYVPSKLLVKLAKHVERLLESIVSGTREVEELSRMGRRIAESYSLEREAKSVLGAWSRILRRA